MSDIIMKVNTVFAVICTWCTPTCWRKEDNDRRQGEKKDKDRRRIRRKGERIRRE